MTLEIEVKFYLPDARSMSDRILAMGAISSGRHFETNICFENRTRTFKDQDILLRLRKDRKTELTFKSRPVDSDKDFKVYRELEVEVDDFDTCREILECLGFHPEQTYEKWREAFALGEISLLVDTTPFGAFLEIEGRKSDIMDTANRLDLKWEERILLNYLAIFEIIRREEKLPFNDMTFDNFKHTDVDVEKYLTALYPDPDRTENTKFEYRNATRSEALRQTTTKSLKLK